MSSNASQPWPSVHNKAFRAVPIPSSIGGAATAAPEIAKAHQALDVVYTAHNISKFTYSRSEVEKFLLENNVHAQLHTENIRPVSEEAVREARTAFLASLSDTQIIHALGSKIYLNLLAVGDLPVTVQGATFEPVSLHQAFITAKGLVLGAKDSYAGKSLKFIFHNTLGFKILHELSEPLNISWNDYIQAAGNLVFIGTSTSTSDEAVRTLLRADVFGGSTIALVRDLFDRNPARPSLSSVLSFLNQDISVVSGAVAGKDNLRRRLVTEYQRGSSGAYEEVIVDMELTDYLKHRGYSVLVADEKVVPKSGVSPLNLGDGHVVFGDAALADWMRSQTPRTSHPLHIHTADGVNSSNLVWLLRTPASVLAPEPSDAPVHWQYHPWKATNPEKPAQSSHKILMVDPVGFISNPQTLVDNHFMKKSELEVFQVERLALEEASRFHLELVRDGVHVYMNCNERFYGAPDALFPNNWFSTHNRAEMGGGPSTLVLYPMKAPARRAERRHHMVQNLMAKYDRTVTMTSWEESGAAGLFLEGTGSLVLDRVRRVAYCLISQRADKDVFIQWCKLTGYTPVAFHAHDKKGLVIYHTNVMMAVGTSVAVLCADSIRDPDERRNVIEHLSKTHHIVYITLDQMDAFCGNVLEVRGDEGAKKMLIMSTRAYDAFTQEQKQDMLKHVDKLFHVAIPTIEDIGGGGVRCMMGELF